MTNLSSVCLPEEKRISICTFVLLIRSKFTSFSQSMLWRVVDFGAVPKIFSASLTPEKLSLGKQKSAAWTGKQIVFEQNDRCRKNRDAMRRPHFRDYVVYNV